MLESTVSREIRRDLRSALLDGKSAYFGEIPPLEPDQLPEDILQKIDSNFPDFTIALVEEESLPGGWRYEVSGSTGTERLEILVNPSGKFLIVERESLAEVFHEMEAEFQRNRAYSLELFILSKAGEVQIESSKTGLSSHALECIQQQENWSEDLLIMKAGEVWIGAVKLYDGNILCITNQLVGGGGVTYRWGKFFALLMTIFLPLSGWIGFHVSKRAMAGVKRVSDSANRVKAGNFSERVEAGTEGTEIEELAIAFNGMVSKVEILMRELRDVTCHIAHDLRTPLARIRGLLENLNWEEGTPDERERLVEAAIEECDRMVPLINTILELAQAEAGMIVLQEEEFDLAADVHTAHSLFSRMAEDRQITFICTVPDHPVRMAGDRNRIQRIISNLLDNALKFTPETGRVSVELQSNEQQAVLTIRDTGPGIPPAELERVFERFYRVDGSRNLPGYGLGLSLVNAFVIALGGTISIKSNEGKGCVITVTIPLGSGKTVVNV